MNVKAAMSNHMDIHAAMNKQNVMNWDFMMYDLGDDYNSGSPSMLNMLGSQELLFTLDGTFHPET